MKNQNCVDTDIAEDVETKTLCIDLCEQEIS